MGLLSSYSNYNKVTDNALRVQYAVEPDIYTYTGWITEPSESGGTVERWVSYKKMFYRVHRYATKSYSYVGMDEATALSCQNDKIAQYTRAFSRVTEVEVPIVDAPGSSGQGETVESNSTQTVLSTAYTYECRSDIVAQHIDGHMWDVIINVNEDDEKFSYVLPSNPASLFAAENQRNYDN